MKLLFLTHRVPFPPNRGDRIRSYHILKFLSRSAEIDLACLTEEPGPETTLRELEKHCRRIAIAPLSTVGRWIRAAASFAGGRSATEGLFESPGLKRTIESWAADTKYDAILVYCSSMGQYLKMPQLRNAPCVVDFIDVDSAKWLDYARCAPRALRWLYRAEATRVRRLEAELIARARAVAVVSEPEAELVREICPDASVHAIPNGVDLDYFGPPSRPASASANDAAATSLSCVFVGALDYFPNIDGVLWFTGEVWPRIRARFPAARFMIVGRNPSQQVRQLAGSPGVEVIGEVTDVRPFLHRATVAVVPLRIARGIQNKALESLAAAKPLVASSKVLQALGVADGSQAFAADANHEWASTILSLFENETLRNQVADRGYRFVREHCNWDRCLQPFEDLLDLKRPVQADSLCATAC